jgi:hypothetical protein
VKPGHWPDADMLPIGYMPRGESGGQERFSNFTPDEQKTVISLWCMFRSPLMFGGNLPQCEEDTIALISNKDVLEINQFSKNNRQVYADKMLRVWTAESTMLKARYIAVFNISDEDMSYDLDTEKAIGIKVDKATDLWENKKISLDKGLDVKAHGVCLIRF